MELPIKCKEKIMQLYPANGKNIIIDSENLIDKVVNKYKLENAQILKDMSYNILIDAYSKDFKNVIVKIGTNKDTICREIEFYNTYNQNNNVCKVYASNREMNYLVMKKASTVHKLDDIGSFTERLKIFKDIFKSIDKEQKFGVTLPEYRYIFKKSVDNCKEQFLQKNINISKKLLQEIENLHLKKYILHGDMHHWNIVLDGNKWKLIDPARICGRKGF